MENNPELGQRPILVVGAARSGTHLLASTIERNMDVAYTGEQNELWKRYAATKRHDMIPAKEATPDVVRKLRSEFAKLKERKGGGRLLEKTPANILRLPFVRRVFPEAKLVYVFRDGRDVAVSARKKYQGDYRKVTRLNSRTASFFERLGHLQETFSAKALHGLSPKNVLTNLRRYSTGALSILGLPVTRVWGPRFPGQREWLRTFSTLEVAAIQWRISVEQAENYLAAHPDAAVHKVRYETLLREPEKTLANVFDFLEAPSSRTDITHDVRGGGQTWKEVLSHDERKTLADLFEATLVKLGYERTIPLEPES